MYHATIDQPTEDDAGMSAHHFVSYETSIHPSYPHTCECTCGWALYVEGELEGYVHKEAGKEDWYSKHFSSIIQMETPKPKVVEHFIISKQSKNPLFPFTCECACGWVFGSLDVPTGILNKDYVLEYYNIHHKNKLL